MTNPSAIDVLGNCVLPTHAKQISILALPSADACDDIPRDAHEKLVTNLAAQWQSLLTDRSVIDVLLEQAPKEAEPYNLVKRVNVRLGTWFARAFFSAVAKYGLEVSTTRWVRSSGTNANLELGNSREHAELLLYLADSRIQAHDIRIFGHASGLLKRTRFRPGLDSIVEFAEYNLHETLADLWRRARSTLAVPELTDALISACMDALESLYEEPSDEEEVDLSGPFSALRLPEIVKLASRDAVVLARYGGAASRVFEQQLALVFQSFGAFVVQTRPGERTVDLLCISGDQSDPMTFLVEAKSSKRPYGLPTDDERALREYVRESRRLTTLPPLKLVLVVAATPAKALGARLRRLEAEEGISVRFMSAALLAQLRAHVTGPLVFGDMYRLLLQEGSVVSPELIKTLRARRAEQQQAHEALVRAMLAP